MPDLSSATPRLPCAVVAGYGPGVGAAVARAFAAEGYSLALIAREQAKLEAATCDLAAAGHQASGFAADVGDHASLIAALDAVRAAHGDPEVLIYNAAFWRPGPTLALSVEDLVADFRVCAAGALTAARAVTPAMRSASRGSLLFTGGGFALYPSPQAPALSIGKAALRALALMLAQELAPNGIKVGTVTIMGMVEPGTSRDPDRIAAAFLDLHRRKPDPADAEIQVA